MDDRAQPGSQYTNYWSRMSRRCRRRVAGMNRERRRCKYRSIPHQMSRPDGSQNSVSPLSHSSGNRRSACRLPQARRERFRHRVRLSHMSAMLESPSYTIFRVSAVENHSDRTILYTPRWSTVLGSTSHCLGLRFGHCLVHRTAPPCRHAPGLKPPK